MSQVVYDDGQFRVLCADALAELQAMPDDAVDVVITDPPYNVGKKFGDYADRMPRREYVKWLGDILLECGRVSRTAVCYTPGAVNMPFVHKVLRRARLSQRRLLFWARKEFAGDARPGGSGPPYASEPVIVAARVGKRPQWGTIWGHHGRDFYLVNCVRTDSGRNRGHPCPKPLEVTAWLLGLMCPKKGTVLDPFCGSGATLVAARDHGMKGIGIDRWEPYCELTKERLLERGLFLPPEPRGDQLAMFGAKDDDEGLAAQA